MRTVSFLTYSLPAKPLLIVVFCLLKWLSGSWVLHTLCWFTSALFIYILSPQGLSRNSVSLSTSGICHYALSHPSIPCRVFSFHILNCHKPTLLIFSIHIVCKQLSFGTYLLNCCQWLLPFMKFWMMDESVTVRCSQVTCPRFHSIHRSEHRAQILLSAPFQGAEQGILPYTARWLMF